MIRNKYLQYQSRKRPEFTSSTLTFLLYSRCKEIKGSISASIHLKIIEMEGNDDNIPVEATGPKSVLGIFDHADEPSRNPKRRKVEVLAEEILNPISDEDLVESSHDTNMEDVGGSEEDIDSATEIAEDDLPEQVYNPHEPDTSEGGKVERAAAILNSFTSINKGTKRKATIDSDDMEKTPRRALPRSPELPGPAPPLVDWLAPKISAAQIRRECGARIPPIHIPNRMLAKEVKSKYGTMLLDLDNKKAQANQMCKRENPQTDEEMEYENETVPTGDSASAPKYISPYANNDQEMEYGNADNTPKYISSQKSKDQEM